MTLVIEFNMLEMNILETRGVHCTKHVRVYVSAQKRYKFEHCRTMYTYNEHI